MGFIQRTRKDGEIKSHSELRLRHIEGVAAKKDSGRRNMGGSKSDIPGPHAAKKSNRPR
jgi:hypothetical protein